MYIDGLGNIDNNVSKTKNQTGNTQFDNIFNSNVSSLDTTKSLEDMFNKASSTYGVDINLIKAVAKAESNFQTDAKSSVGATGIMQLMPSTASYLGVKDINDPEQNIMGGTKLLKQLLDTYDGDKSLALAAYNAGIGNVQKYGGIPPFKETQNYVTKVLGYMGENISVPDKSYTTNGNTNGSNSQTIDSMKGIGIIDSLKLSTIDTNDSTSIANSLFTYEQYMKFLKIYEEAVSKLYDSTSEDDTTNSNVESNDSYLSNQYKSYTYNNSIIDLF